MNRRSGKAYCDECLELLDLNSFESINGKDYCEDCYKIKEAERRGAERMLKIIEQFIDTNRTLHSRGLAQNQNEFWQLFDKGK